RFRFTHVGEPVYVNGLRNGLDRLATFFSELDWLSMTPAGCFAAGRRRLRRSRSLTASPARKLCRQAIQAVLRSVQNEVSWHGARSPATYAPDHQSLRG